MYTTLNKFKIPPNDYYLLQETGFEMVHHYDPLPAQVILHGDPVGNLIEVETAGATRIPFGIPVNRDLAPEQEVTRM